MKRALIVTAFVVILLGAVGVPAALLVAREPRPLRIVGEVVGARGHRAVAGARGVLARRSKDGYVWAPIARFETDDAGRFDVVAPLSTDTTARLALTVVSREGDAGFDLLDIDQRLRSFTGRIALGTLEAHSLGHGRHLRIHVVSDGHPVPHATVELQQWGGCKSNYDWETDGEGLLDIPFQEADLIRLSDPAFVAEEHDVTDEPGPRIEVTLEAHPRTPLRGVVVDAKGVPVANAPVQLRDAAHPERWIVGATTDALGGFEFPDAVPGTRYRLEIDSLGAMPSSALTLCADPLEVAHPSGPVLIQARDGGVLELESAPPGAWGQRPTVFEREVAPGEFRPDRLRTSGEGRFFLPPGRWRAVIVSENEGIRTVPPFTIEAGETTKARSALAGRSVKGRLVDAHKRPVYGWLGFQCGPFSIGLFLASNTANGRFVAQGIPLEKTTLLVGAGLRRGTPLTIEPGAAGDVVDLGDVPIR